VTAQQAPPYVVNSPDEVTRRAEPATWP